MLARLLKVARFAAGDLLWKVANVVVLAVAARTLPPHLAALVVLSQTASMILLSLGDLGFRASGIRLISLAPSSCDKVISAVTKRRLLSVLVVGLPTAAICCAVLADDAAAFWGLALLVVAYLPYFATQDWALLALGRTGHVALARGMYGLVLIGLALSALLFDVSLGYFAFLIVAGYSAFALVSWLLLKYLKGNVAGEYQSVDVRVELGWSSSLVMATAFALNTLFHSLEVLMAGALLGEGQSAAFAAPFRLIFSIYAVGWMLTQYYSPQFARIFKGEARVAISYSLIFVAVGALGSLVTFEMAPWLIALIYDDAFGGASVTLQGLAPTILLDALAASFGTFLIMQNRGSASAISLSIGCAMSVVTFYSVQHLGLAAAISAKYAAYTGLLLSQCYFIARMLRRSPT